MSASTYFFSAVVPQEVLLPGSEGGNAASRRLRREEFFAWVWNEFGGTRGLVGIHEGTMLSEDAARVGLETDSWTVDSAEAPRERDWVEGQSELEALFYFSTQKQAESAWREFKKLARLTVGPVSELKAQDWDAQWKAAYLSSETGVAIPPFWRIVPPWVEPKLGPEELALKINPGAGFGTGTHETTQLCLQALAQVISRAGGTVRETAGTGLDRRIATTRVLDFGSGSGILSIGAALLGAQVSAVEIDPLANENAAENAKLNSVEERLKIQQTLEGLDGPFDIVVANILRPVLLEFAPRLVQRLRSGGALILSGLIEADVQPVSSAYASLLGREPEVRRLGEWRALVWR